MIMRSISNKTIGKTVSRNIAVLIFFFLGSISIMAQEVDDEYIPFVEEVSTGGLSRCVVRITGLIYKSKLI